MSTLDDEIDELQASVDRANAQIERGIDSAFALLVIQFSGLAQSPELLARLDLQQRQTLSFLCEELVKALSDKLE